MAETKKESEYKRKIMLRVDQEDLPEIKDWEVGEEYELEITVKMVAKSQGDPYGMESPDEKKGSKIEATFEVTEIEPEEEDEDTKGLDKKTKKRVKEIGDKMYG